MTQTSLSVDIRAKIGLAIVGAAVLLLFFGLVRLQVFKHAEYAKQSRENRLRVEPIIPKRGIVYDRDGRRIIDNRPSYTVSVVPAEEMPGVTLPQLAELLQMDTLTIRKRIRKHTISRYQPATVKRDVPFKAIAVIEEQNTRFPGVSWQAEQVRQYPTGLGSETFTGYVGEVSGDEIRKPGDSLLLGRMIGKKGIERQYDKALRGTEGEKLVEVSASGQIIGEYLEDRGDEAIPGVDLELTIDMDLQQACSLALDTFCCGAIVAANPKTGEILAMASYPGYNANIFSGVIPESLWLEITADSTHPLLNRPLAGLYPPGSTVKFVTVGAALEEGIVTPHTTLKPCLGGYQFGNRFFRCWEPAGHGHVTAAHSLEQSCDVYMYQIGLKMGVDKLSEYYGRCGFGQPTGIDLPGELKGLNPNSEWYDKNYGKNRWTRGLVLNNSIGQGELLTTPLQLAQFFCGLANDGLVPQLHMVKRRIFPDGSEEVTEPRVAFSLPFSNATMRTLLEGLALVVQGEKGTARSLRRKEYTVGGKTGTAQNPHGENHSLFCGVAPLEDPEIIVVAIVENAGHGSVVAAPVVGEIIETYMRKKAGGLFVVADKEVPPENAAAVSTAELDEDSSVEQGEVD